MARRWAAWVITLSLVLPAARLGAAAGTGGENAQLATPKLAAFAFVRAMEQNDMAQFRSVTIGSDDDYKLFEPLLGMVGAAKQLEQAAHEKFGKAARVIVRDSPAVELEVHIQESEVKVTGDAAVLHHAGDAETEALNLRHTSEGWKIDLTAIPNRAQMSTAADAMARTRKALSDSAEQIRAGRFQTAEQAEQDLLKRIKQAAQGK